MQGVDDRGQPIGDRRERCRIVVPEGLMGLTVETGRLAGVEARAHGKLDDGGHELVMGQVAATPPFDQPLLVISEPDA
jgi:hypothetical protein